MTVAHFAECRELYELSGRGTFSGAVWQHDEAGRSWLWRGVLSAGLAYIPAYDLGTLMSMLPNFTLTKRGNESYHAEWHDYADGVTISADSRTNPTNALCRLAIALFMAGVLMRKDS